MKNQKPTSRGLMSFYFPLFICSLLFMSGEAVVGQTYPAFFDPSTVDGTNGIKLIGEQSNLSFDLDVSSAGDINGDGYDDVIVGYSTYSSGPNIAIGKSYVVFGQANPSLSIDLTQLNGSNGFVVEGENQYDQLGTQVSGAGDINGDGFDDMIFGVPYADVGFDDNVGKIYILFGTDNPFPDTIRVENIDSTMGLTIIGINEDDNTGGSASKVGDINNDGFNDMIFGVPGGVVDGYPDVGRSYVIYGSNMGWGSEIEIRYLDSLTGFYFEGIEAYDRSGGSVSSAGDVNGDGIDDILIGAWAADVGDSIAAGESYVVFGKTGNFKFPFPLSSLDGTNGFTIQGLYQSSSAGAVVSSAGDMNGDGFSDLVITTRANSQVDPRPGESYVIFGKANFPTILSVSTLDGNNGFTIVESASYDFLPWRTVTHIHDINGDGFDDIMVGAMGMEVNGKEEAGEAYVVYGKSGSFIDVLNTSQLDGTNGFTFYGNDEYQYVGATISSAGDFNGDGAPDIILGVPRLEESNSETYIIFGNGTGTGTNNLSFLDESLIKIAPNPSRGHLKVHSPSIVIESVILYDFIGRSIPIEVSYERHEAQIRTNFHGLGILHVNTLEGVITRKIVFE